MKWMIASDIHGSSFYCKKLLERLEEEHPDRLLLLGDTLYHGPRNDLPLDYDTKAVTAMLNARKDMILSVRGNCDADIDQVVLEFPILADYCIICENGQTVFATHGHLFNEEHLPPLHKGDILLHGHTHRPVCTEHDTYTYINPGSVAIPKDGSECSYMIWNEGIFTWKTIEGKEYLTFRP